MKTLKKTLTLVFILLPFLGMADVVPIKMHELLFGSDLIVKVKIVSHTQHDYKIKILDVYRDYQIGIKAGDYINIQKEMNVETSVDIVHREHIEDRLTGVAFLGKGEYGWGVYSFPFFYDEELTLKFDTEDCEIKGKASYIKDQIQSYFKEFKKNDEGELVGRKTEKEAIKSNLTQLVILQYGSIYGPFSKFAKKYKEQLNCGIVEVVE